MAPAFKKITLILLIVITMILILEGAARLLLSRRKQEPVIPTEIGRFDANLGWAKIPLANAVSKGTGEAIEYRINSHGLRDDETSYEKPNGVYRIVLYLHDPQGENHDNQHRHCFRLRQ